MGLCQEDATENVCAQVLQLVGIGSPSDAASDYIVKGNNILAFEPNFIKLDDAHLADFLLQFAVFVDGKATTGYLYMVVAVAGYRQEAGGEEWRELGEAEGHQECDAFPAGVWGEYGLCGQDLPSVRQGKH